MMLRIQIRKGKEHLQQCVNTLGKQKFWEDIPVVFESDYEGDERMVDKDQKAFENWYINGPYKEDYHASPDQLREAWFAALKYKQVEIDELKYCSQVFYEATKKVGW